MKQRNLSTIIFFEHDGRILLQDRRSITKFGEEWGPFGGSIETGETPDQAIRREVKEELDYQLTEIDLVGVYFGTLSEDLKFKEYLHIAKFPGYPALHQQEGDHMNLFTLEEAKNLKLLPAYYQMLDDVKTYLEDIYPTLKL